MKKSGMICFTLLLAAMPAAIPAKTHAQQNDAKPTEARVHYYHLRFDVEEVGEDGKITNSRTYQTLITSGLHEFGRIRTGNKVPVQTGSVTNDKTESKQIQYLDVGVNIDANAADEIGDKLALHVKAEISSIASSDLSSIARQVGDPVVRQNSWDSTVLIIPGKPNVIYSADNLDNKGRMQVELTAIRIE